MKPIPPIPPIPPDCPYFDIGIAGTNVFHAPTPPGRSWSDNILLDNPGDWRPIIAAVARCAWLDEAERLNEQVGMDGSMRLVLKAQDNADAWAAWGRGE